MHIWGYIYLPLNTPFFEKYGIVFAKYTVYMEYVCGDVITVKKITYTALWFYSHNLNQLVLGDHWIIKQHYIPNLDNAITFYKLIHMSGNHTVIVDSRELKELFKPFEEPV